MPTKPEFRQSQWDGSVERRAPNPDAFGLILHRLDSMESKQDDLQGSLSELAKSMTRLALAEERIAQVNDALGRAFKAIEKQGEQVQKLQETIDERLVSLEKVAPLNSQARTYVFSALIAMATAAAAYIGIHTGLVSK